MERDSREGAGALTGSHASTEPASRLGPSGFDPERGFLLKSWDVTVHGYGTERIVAASRGKAFAKAWRCDAFNRLTFGDFLKIAEAWKALLVPTDFGEPILVQRRPAFRVGKHGPYVSFVWPFTETVLTSHPSDVTAIAMAPRQRRQTEICRSRRTARRGPERHRPPLVSQESRDHGE